MLEEAVTHLLDRLVGMDERPFGNWRNSIALTDGFSVAAEGDPVVIPGQDPVTIPGQDPVTIPGQDLPDPAAPDEEPPSSAPPEMGPLSTLIGGGRA